MVQFHCVQFNLIQFPHQILGRPVVAPVERGSCDGSITLGATHGTPGIEKERLINCMITVLALYAAIGLMVIWDHDYKNRE